MQTNFFISKIILFLAKGSAENIYYLTKYFSIVENLKISWEISTTVRCLSRCESRNIKMQDNGPVFARSLFPFPRAVFRPLSGCFPSHSRVHVSDFIHARAIRLHALVNRESDLTIGTKCSRYHASRVRERAMQVYAFHTELMRSTNSVAHARSLPRISLPFAFNFSECPIEKQFRDAFDEFRVDLSSARISQRSLTEVEVSRRTFISSIKILELLALKGTSQ